MVCRLSSAYCAAGLSSGIIMKLDNKDRKIIEELKKDSRAPVRYIAKKTGMKHSTVHQRIARLRKEGIIEKFTVKIDSAKAGEGFTAFLLVSTEGDESNFLLEDKRIREVFEITGEYNLLLKLKFSEISEFSSFASKLRKNKSVSAVKSSVATNVIMEDA